MTAVRVAIGLILLVPLALPTASADGPCANGSVLGPAYAYCVAATGSSDATGLSVQGGYETLGTGLSAHVMLLDANAAGGSSTEERESSRVDLRGAALYRDEVRVQAGVEQMRRDEGASRSTEVSANASLWDPLLLGYAVEGSYLQRAEGGCEDRAEARVRFLQDSVGNAPTFACALIVPYFESRAVVVTLAQTLP